MTGFMDQGVILNPDGVALSVKHQRIADIIHDYDPELELVMLPPASRDDEDSKKYPFAILHYPANGVPYLVHKYKESEVNESIIADLFLRDAKNVNVLDRLEAEENAREAVKMKERMDEHEEMMDFTKTVVKSPLHAFKHNGVRYD